jgi:hypothetical protein
MANDTQKPLEDDSSELVKFKRLAMAVVGVEKDDVYRLYPALKIKDAKNTTRKAKFKR